MPEGLWFDWILYRMRVRQARIAEILSYKSLRAVLNKDRLVENGGLNIAKNLQFGCLAETVKQMFVHNNTGRCHRYLGKNQRGAAQLNIATNLLSICYDPRDSCSFLVGTRF
jgi:hypothetical protein